MSATNEAQLVEWYTQWRKPLRKWLHDRCSVSPAEVEDLAQEVFLRLMRYEAKDVVGNPAGYLFRIASNIAAEWRERTRNARPHDDVWLETILAPEGEEPEIQFESRALTETVNRWIDDLPERQRHCLLLHVYQKLSYREIAVELGLTYRIVLRELTRAYSTLRLVAKEEGFVL